MNRKHTIKKLATLMLQPVLICFLRLGAANNPLLTNKPSLRLLIVLQQIKKDWFLWLKLFCFVGGKYLLSEGTTTLLQFRVDAGDN